MTIHQISSSIPHMKGSMARFVALCQRERVYDRDKPKTGSVRGSLIGKPNCVLSSNDAFIQGRS
jgi:hypothetical protein